LIADRVVDRIARSKLRWDARRLLRAARILRPWPAFLIGESRGGRRRYRIGDQRVVVRHRSRDIAIVNEIFGPGSPYEPPASIAPRLSGPLRVVDLGANVGLFGVFAFARWQVTTLLSFEPDPSNLALLTRTRDLNGWSERWEVRDQAVGNFTGTTTFVGLGSPESRTAAAGEAGIPVGVTDVFTLQTPIDLLKIDIEGSEWEILADPRLAELDARVIVIEWHRRAAPRRDDAHEAAREALEAAGYRIHRDDHSGAAYGIGVIWAGRA
jgi:FkbM family methyltransferase